MDRTPTAAVRLFQKDQTTYHPIINVCRDLSICVASASLAFDVTDWVPSAVVCTWAVGWLWWRGTTPITTLITAPYLTVLGPSCAVLPLAVVVMVEGLAWWVRWTYRRAYPMAYGVQESARKLSI